MLGGENNSRSSGERLLSTEVRALSCQNDVVRMMIRRSANHSCSYKIGSAKLTFMSLCLSTVDDENFGLPSGRLEPPVRSRVVGSYGRGSN